MIPPISETDVLLSFEREERNRGGRPRGVTTGLPSFLRLQSSGRGFLGALHETKRACAACGGHVFVCGSVRCPNCAPAETMLDVLKKVTRSG
jgi:hypothetical protein